MKLIDLLGVMPYTALFDLDSDQFIQLIDGLTLAHYRVIHNDLCLGGEPCGHDYNWLMDRMVLCVEYIDDQCVIAIG